jgi:hypothetical protein
MLLGLALLPVLAYTAFEFFIDPFPRSLWILRVLNTNYLVHVRADLTIDGEPLVMERTIRCFNHVDYYWFPGGRQPAANGQAGDMLAAVTSKGRLFALEVLEACYNRSMHPKWRAIPTEGIAHLGKGEIRVPRVYEIIGGRAMKQIDEYTERDRLSQGYHGVQLNDIVYEVAPKVTYLRDWTDYEWFGWSVWSRPYLGRGSMASYSNFSLVMAEEAVWDRIISLGYQHFSYLNEAQLKVYENDIKRFLYGETNRTISSPQEWPYNPFYPYFEGNYEKDYAFSPKASFPCLFDKGAQEFICDRNKEGIRTYLPSQIIMPPFIVNLGDHRMAFNSGREVYVSSSNKAVFSF